MRKVFSLIIALIMAVTIIYVPTATTTYAEENINDNINSEEMTNGEGLDNDIVLIDISEAEVTFKYFSYDYYGTARKPVPTVTHNGVTLIKDADYTIEYENNIYPGRATAIIKGINNYTSEKRVDFSIARIKQLAVKERKNKSLMVSWAKKPNVSGYELQKYNEGSGTWETIAVIEDENKNEYLVEGLSVAHDYRFMARSFVKDSEGNIHYSEWSNELSTTTQPSQGKITKLATNVKMELKITWAERTCDGYQIYMSKNKKFPSPIKRTISSQETLTNSIKAPKNNTTYYVKIRAYKIFEGKKVYGLWSPIKKIKTDGTGWAKFSGRKYYYKNGKPLKGTQRINGNPYFFGKNTGVLLGSSTKMYNKTKKAKSDTKYLIGVCRKDNRVCIYEKSKGEWVVKYYWKCSTGEPTDYSTISCTPSGSFKVPRIGTHKKYFGDRNGYRCWYTTKIYKGYLFHSVLYQPRSSTKIQDGRLGYNISHGCIRLKKDNAYWMYKNIKAGTRVIIL